MSEEFNNQNSESIENNNENTETSNNENPEVSQNNTRLKTLPLGKIIAILVAVFVVVFLAVYCAVDRCMHKLGFTPFVVTMEQMEKLFDDSDRFLEKSSPAPVKIETDDDKYVVTIDLKSFDNNPDNIKIDITENGIKINGQFKQDKDGNVKENSFYQNVIFPNQIDPDKMEKKIKKDRIKICLLYTSDAADE